MGRAPYTEEERKAIITTLALATKDLIAKEGINAVSIRKVAARADCSSATIYLYFKNVDDLISLSCIGYLEDYCHTLATEETQDETAEETFYRGLDLFCRATLCEPQVFLRLFFRKHTRSLNELVHLYYSVFPEQLDNLSASDISLVMAGGLKERGMRMLLPYTSELGFSNDETALIEDVLRSYYRACLEEASDTGHSDADVDSLTRRIEEVARFLLSKAA